MHSHPHRLTHPDKRGCVVYSRQLGRMAKLGILCRPEEKPVFVRFLQSVFYHTPQHGRSGIQRCNKAEESLHRLAVLLQMLSPLTVCVNRAFLKRRPCPVGYFFRLFIFVNWTNCKWMNLVWKSSNTNGRNGQFALKAVRGFWGFSITVSLTTGVLRSSILSNYFFTACSFLSLLSHDPNRPRQNVETGTSYLYMIVTISGNGLRSLLNLLLMKPVCALNLLDLLIAAGTWEFSDLRRGRGHESQKCSSVHMFSFLYSYTLQHCPLVGQKLSISLLSWMH